MLTVRNSIFKWKKISLQEINIKIFLISQAQIDANLANHLQILFLNKFEEEKIIDRFLFLLRKKAPTL